ncbi:hypothetical protein LEN26_010735 [Aphanomyces euteiches]|nr:hypothetical protein LEN26_010735 [Aphanomyces euteiches]
MNKVHVSRPYEPSVRFNRWSVAYNIVFVINLATTPFMAYMTEPLPGRVTQTSLPEWSSFEEYTDFMAAFFQRLYNNQTIESPDIVCVRDTSSNTFATRAFVEIPFGLPESHVSSFFLRLPGSAFYGAGVEKYMSAFLTANVSTRTAMKPWRICEHELLVGIQFGELCFWIDQVDSRSDNLPRYELWAAILSRETLQVCWFKFVFRSLVTMYVLIVLWRQYYRHYNVLVFNLRTLGLGSEFTHYHIVLGDPAYAILSDPYITLAMFIDIWYASPYMTIATLRVSQFQDVWTYVLCCIYLSRTVWCAYLCMRCLSAVIKWRRWEASFAPVDPGFLAISTYLY